MDRGTYNLLSQRLDYLELVANTKHKLDDATPSYLARLSKVNNDLNQLIISNHPSFLRIIELFKQYGLWDSIVSEDSPNNINDPDPSSIEARKLMLLANHEYFVSLITKIQSLMNLNPHEVIHNRFPVQVVEHQQLLGELQQFLTAELIPKRFNPLIINSITVIERYVEIINDYNLEIDRLKNQLMEFNLSITKKKLQKEREVGENSY
ncbi:hypothetical protein DASC09_010460 [Saccharomycopsis crataegensis]|uniref:Uncharacterized protein n=1 Tax=Saccharomycopsis crataegensis TaxID=43959 RepID=A0AAV5QGJ6_9ASCO|nr:hypothetical protein DASC09_010460 [Saccharomycopsis crataegensis]